MISRQCSNLNSLIIRQHYNDVNRQSYTVLSRIGTSMLSRITSDPGLSAEKVTRVRIKRLRKHTSYSEQLNHGKSSTFRQMEKLLIQMSRQTKMSPRGNAPSSDTHDYKRVRMFIHVPNTQDERLEALRAFRNDYSHLRICGWNLRIVNEFRGDGQCWVVILFVKLPDKK